ncbi:4F5 domain protein [Aspergillus affinis]|uniref:4F5 domain protein n=1 Tax=Aspergillus affinis TaxID=1070780 RepID=UPI0022FEC1BD|nr:uncharacterized protein KD926_010704 [Aspergillus affinis]KAI9038492.1 hypothetical protein KD926_010704 [Aspergillus affinis]
MTRGNQREKARAKNQKAEGAVKSKNTMTGTEFQRHKESSAAIMREKQKLEAVRYFPGKLKGKDPEGDMFAQIGGASLILDTLQ